MVVEGDEGVRANTAKMLVELGYRVLEVPDVSLASPSIAYRFNFQGPGQCSRGRSAVPVLSSD